MRKIDYLIEEQQHSDDVAWLVERYRRTNPKANGDFALAERIEIGREAYDALKPEDFHKFFRAIVVTDAMREAPHLYERVSANT